MRLEVCYLGPLGAPGLWLAELYSVSNFVRFVPCVRQAEWFSHTHLDGWAFV